MKSFLMIHTSDVKQFIADTPQLRGEELTITKEHHESLMQQYKTMATQTVRRMSQIALQIKLLNEEEAHLMKMYKDLYNRHDSHRKEWEKLSEGNSESGERPV